MSLASLKRTSEKVDTGEILDVLGPRLQFLTALSDDDHDYCLNKGSVPPGVVVPLHSHPERETFYVLEGQVEGLWKDRWITLGGGDPFDVPGGLKHGWRIYPTRRPRCRWWYLCGWADSFAILVDR